MRSTRRPIRCALGAALFVAAGWLPQAAVADNGVVSLAARAAAPLKPLEWLDLEAGLERVRAERRPALVWYRAEGGEAIDLDALVASSSSLRRVIDSVVRIRVEPEAIEHAYPPPPPRPGDPPEPEVPKPGRPGPEELKPDGAKPDGAKPDGAKPDGPRPGGETDAEKGGAGDAPPPAEGRDEGENDRKQPGEDPAELAKPGEGEDVREKPEDPAVAPEDRVRARLLLIPADSSILLLDFRETLVRRHDRKPPSARELAGELRNLLTRDARLARRAREVEPRLAAARIAYRQGKSRDAVLALREFDDVKTRQRLDAVLASWIGEVLSDLRVAAGADLEEAKRLEAEGDRRQADSAKKYTQAMEAYQKIARDYPLSDVAQDANKRAGAILRKLTLTGENPFGR